MLETQRTERVSWKALESIDVKSIDFIILTKTI